MNNPNIPDGSLISFMSNKVKATGGINLAQGIPGFAPPEELLNILRLITKDNIHQYAPGTGNESLVNILLNHYEQYFQFRKENFLVVNGATEAVSLIFIYLLKLLNQPFSALSFDPVYESYEQLPKIFDCNFISFPMDVSGNIDFFTLQKSIKKNNVRIVFISSPGNPYGRALTENELKSLIDLSLKLDFYIVFDAVYKDLYFNEKPYIPLNLFNDRLFYVNSFSKMLSITGWRVGYIITHQIHSDIINSIHDYIGLCAPSLLQEAIARYLKEYDFGKKYMEHLRSKLQKSHTLMKDALLKLNFYLPPIEGGYFIWAKLPDNINDGYKFAIDLYDKEKVAVIPGIHFSKNCPDYVRINIAREEDEINLAIKKIYNYFKLL